MKKPTPGESGLSRAMKILAVFNSEHSTLSPAEIARRTNLPVASTYRMVNEMVKLGILDKTSSGVQTGVRLWELASRGSKTVNLRNTALPYMEDIQRAMQQHTQLGVLEGKDVLFLERLSASEGAVVNILKVAERLPAIISAPGLVIAAFSPLDVQQGLLAEAPKRYTSLTPTDTKGFPAILADIRRKGFVQIDGWIAEGVSAVSAPIRDAEGSVVAALSVLLPNDGKTPRVAHPVVQIAAAGISRALGYAPVRAG
ncbi:IclR family transcriptional regulator [Pseudarthrobacter sp. NPDC058196]|uniref:IclR family transcriptional regulator n=1 Tax=Pseudarthrobacter sp. NPDC058196 TaxID=3346376 RepID=UPI0036DF7BFA